MKWICFNFLLSFILVVPLFSQEDGSVIITEIMYNAASNETTEKTQYIEIANTTSNAVSLNNWTIDDEDADGPNTLPDITLPPFGIAVICGSSASDFQGAFGSGFTVISVLDNGETMFNLANSPSSTSEIIQLKDAFNNLVDEVNYDDANPWPNDPGGYSIYLDLQNNQMNATSNNSGSNWSLSSSGVDGAFTSTISGVWNALEVGSPGNINGDASLPVTLTSFTTTAGNGRVILHWTTESEIDNAGFEILRATVQDGDYMTLSSYVNNDDLKGRLNATTPQDYRFIDHHVVNGITYWYKLADVAVNGEKTFHGPLSATPQAVGDELVNSTNSVKGFEVYPNYPNPFNPETTLKFDIPRLQDDGVEVRFFVYNAVGQRVKTLYDGRLAPGGYAVTWNGRTDNGSLAPSGIYYAVLRSDYYTKSVKMLLLK